MLVSGNIPNLISGVSQQPAALRSPTHLDLQENCYSSVVDGLKDRPPTEHIAKVFTGQIGNAFMHMLNRDTAERYQVIIRQNSIQVFGIDGVERTVNIINGTGYLNEAAPSTAFRAVTVADYTFLVNKNKIVVMDAALTANRGGEGIVFVKKGEYGSHYKVFIDGVEKASKLTSTTDVNDLRSNDIADTLRSQLVTNLGAGWTMARSGSVVHIKKDDGAAFKLKVEDSQGGASLVSFQTKTRKFSDLPTRAPDGYVLAIDQNPDTQDGMYYVKFVVNSAGDTFGEGTWAETIKQGIKFKFDPATMPHVLIRNSNDTFDFKQATWIDRKVGDESSNPEPSFVAFKFNDVFFYKNRLMFLSDDSILGSETGKYFNFWRTTVTELLDSDPIDSSVLHTKVSILRHAVPFDTHCILFSDQTQFKMSGENALTPKSIRAEPVKDFECSLDVKPIGVGSVLYFANNKGNFNGVRELYIDDATNNIDANDVTGHVPAYIPFGLFKFAASTVEDILVGITTGDQSAVYNYKYYWNDKKEKVQSAWSRWTLGDPATTKVLDVNFIETTMYLLVQRTDGVYLEKMRVISGLVDPFVNYMTHLDRRITENGLTRVYNSTLDQTTITLPYAVDGVMKVATRADSATPIDPPGKEVEKVSQSGTTLVVKGDYTTKPLWIGQQYTRKWRPSIIHVRRQSSGGGLVLDPVGRLQLLKGHLVYNGSGFFKVSVTPEGRSSSDYIFIGRIVGDINNVIGQVALPSGRFTFSILSKNERVTIEVSNDSFLPFRLTSLEWEGNHIKRSRGI